MKAGNFRQVSQNDRVAKLRDIVIFSITFVGTSLILAYLLDSFNQSTIPVIISIVGWYGWIRARHSSLKESVSKLIIVGIVVAVFTNMIIPNINGWVNEWYSNIPEDEKPIIGLWFYFFVIITIVVVTFSWALRLIIYLIVQLITIGEFTITEKDVTIKDNSVIFEMDVYTRFIMYYGFIRISIKDEYGKSYPISYAHTLPGSESKGNLVKPREKIKARWIIPENAIKGAYTAKIELCDNLPNLLKPFTSRVYTLKQQTVKFSIT